MSVKFARDGAVRRLMVHGRLVARVVPKWRSFNVVSFPRKRESRAPARARPSLDARFRGHDTDVFESSSPLNDSGD